MTESEDLVEKAGLLRIGISEKSNQVGRCNLYIS